MKDDFADYALMLLRLRRIKAEVNKGTPPSESLKMLAQMIDDQQACDQTDTAVVHSHAVTRVVRLA